MSGGLAALVVAGPLGSERAHMKGSGRPTSTPRRTMRAAVNLGLNAYVAAAVCAVLPGMTSVAMHRYSAESPLGLALS